MSRKRLSGRAAAVLSRHSISSSSNSDRKGANRLCTEAVATDREKESVIESIQTPPVASNRFHRGYVLTDEQNHAVNLALLGGSLKIEAYAGAGKTSTLEAISESMSTKRGLYLAFNKTIATEAASKFPANVECRTAHSMAFAAVGRHYKDRLQRLSGSVLSEYLGLKQGVYGLTVSATGNLIIDMLTKYCHSDSIEICRDHGPWTALKAIQDKSDRYAIVDSLIPLARKAWEKMVDRRSSMPITHDTYLKLWALSNPTIGSDFILFDEAQDANPLMLSLVRDQSAQQIYVGDRYQQIYSWRGAVNAMQVLKTDHACRISQSFRFGQPIADVANSILNNQLDAGVAIKGFDKIDSAVCDVSNPDAILCRTNGSLIGALISRLARGERVAVAGGCSEILSLLRGARDLMSGKRTAQKDLALFEKWVDVIDFSQTESGSDLALIVKLIDEHDVDSLINSLDQVSNIREKGADIVLSTAHKSKGREWGSVRLENDFRHADSKGYTDEETNLLYVAATRAINRLDITECDAANIAISLRL